MAMLLYLLGITIRISAEAKLANCSFHLPSQASPSELRKIGGFPRPYCHCNSVEKPYNQSKNIVGFYNVFNKKEDRFKRILAEQINLLESTGLVEASKAIHVVYIGKEPSAFRVPSFSSKFVVSSRSLSGSEQFTLQLLYDHCVDNVRDVVFYIHSKGTFHPTDENEILRRNLMKAIAACWKLNGMAYSDVCGLRASPLPHPHYSGNMWLARCDYVAKLHPPATFTQAMAAATNDVRNLRGCMPAIIGSGRFAQEHWVLSHPSVVASDVLPLPSSPAAPLYTWAYHDLPDPQSWTPDLRTFPRPGLPVSPFLAKGFLLSRLACSSESHRLFEYRALYGAGATAGLPCASMYCQWYPLAFAQLGGAGDCRLEGFVRDMLAVGAAAAAH